MEDWREEEILITVRAYPEPSERYIETSCVAGITRDGRIFRLHPIPDRLLASENRFRKYDVLRLRVKRSEDPRPESHRVDLDHGFPQVRHIGTKNAWAERNRWVEPFRARSIEELKVDDVRISRSLALIRPRKIDRLEIKPKESDDWQEKQRAKLSRISFVMPERVEPLEFIPYRFSYHFQCDDDRCRGHRMSIVDWEVAQSYRKWREDYEEKWEEKFRQKYEEQLLKKDLQFFVGTMMKHPKSWIIIGLYYPPRQSKVPNIQLPLIT